LSVLVRTGSNCAVDCNQFGLVQTGFFAVRSGPSLFGNWSSPVFSKKGKKTGLNLTFKPYIYLLSLGNELTAKSLMDFLHQVDIKEKYGIKCDITYKMVCRYLQVLGYHYQSTPKGQYVDGHEREDVVTYQEKVFLPK